MRRASTAIMTLRRSPESWVEVRPAQPAAVSDTSQLPSASIGPRPSRRRSNPPTNRPCGRFDGSIAVIRFGSSATVRRHGRYTTSAASKPSSIARARGHRPISRSRGRVVGARSRKLAEISRVSSRCWHIYSNDTIARCCLHTFTRQLATTNS